MTDDLDPGYEPEELVDRLRRVSSPSSVHASGWRRTLSWRHSPRAALRKRLDDAIGTTHRTSLSALESLIAEGDLRAHDFRVVSRWWSRTYYLLGVPAAVLAAVAGATALAGAAGRVPAAIIALVSAGLTAAATFVGSDRNRDRADLLGAGWQDLADHARFQLLQITDRLATEPRGRVITRRFWDRVTARSANVLLAYRGTTCWLIFRPAESR